MKALSSCNWPVLAIAAGSVLTAWVSVSYEPPERTWHADEPAMQKEAKSVPLWGDACSQGRPADCVGPKHH